MNNYELKKVQVAKNLSEETTAFTAELWKDGRLIAYCSNRGHGDPIKIDYVSKTDEEQHVDWCDRQEPIMYEPGSQYEKLWPKGLAVDPEIHVGELLENHELIKDLTRQCKKAILYRLRGMERGQYYQVRNLNARSKIVAEHGDQIELIFNDDILAAVKSLKG